MLTNKKWFNTYAVIRTAIVLVMVLLFLFKISPFYLSAYKSTWTILTAIFIPLLSTILLFDYLQKPSFLELSKVEKGLVLKMYQPDSRYFFFLKKRAVKQLILSEGDKLTYQIQQSILSVFNKIIFIIQKKNGEVLKTNQINIGWMSQNQLNILNQLVKAQNNPIN